MRVDKFLANSGIGSRKEVKKLIKEKRVRLGDEIIKDPGKEVKDSDLVYLDNVPISYKKYVYIVMNKRAGVVSAVEDNIYQTVVEELDDYLLSFKPFPVGRLDRDTTGLLILTNDGDFSHNCMHPKRGVKKTYLALVDRDLEEKDVVKFQKGIFLEEENIRTKEAKLEILEDRLARVTITEGKYHQVKRMFKACEKNVIELKRIKIGEYELPEDLKLGDYREVDRNSLDKIFE
ncbi:pseudouridine synthase [Citroniella saccharovorans]